MKKEQLRQEVFNLLKDFVSEDVEIKGDSRFEKDLGLDSLDLVEFVMQCETRFGKPVTDEQIESIKVVDDLVNFLI